MFGVIVRFPVDVGLDREQAAKIAAGARTSFEGMPGLRLKAFTYDEDAGRATNFYLWQSEDAARTFFSDELRALVRELYGADPAIEFVEILELVENPAE
jgi:hypothetical protein